MATAEPVEASVHPTAEGSAWAPFHSPTFAAMCSARFASKCRRMVPIGRA